jgi:hypothetical protein
VGDWNINIQGVGIHHNGDRTPQDANRMAKQFVQDLKKAGHSVTAATFTHGGKEDLKD